MTALRALRRLPPLETAILVLGIGILTWVGLAARGNSPENPPLDSFSTYDAASGGYRAFYTLLADEGVRVERFERHPAFLDASIATLVYVEPSPFDPRAIVPSESDVVALEAWVRRGGTLLYIGHDDVAAKRGVLRLPFSVTPRWPARVRAVRAPEIARAGVERLAPSNGLRWKLPKSGVRVLYGDARGALAVEYPFGRGRVRALIDESIFAYAKLGAPDRARFAYALALPRDARGVVAFDETPHGYFVAERWWQIVPRSFALALALALAAVLVAIAGAAVRLGPPVLAVERRERSSADFIDAFSSLLERAGARRKALRDATNSATHAIARSLGLRADAPQEEIAARIERADLRAAFGRMRDVATNGFPDESNLLRGVALAQELRKEFAAHGRPRN
jgi:hypothetical protein